MVDLYPLRSTSESLYEMADYLDVPALRDFCKTAYLAMIQPSNFLQELVHRFARLHKPISEALEAYAVKNWVRSDTIVVTESRLIYLPV